MISEMRLFGDDPVKLWTSKDPATGEYTFSVDIGSYGIPKGVQYKKAINNGMLRSLIEKQYTQLTGTLMNYSGESFSNPNKIEKVKNRMLTLQKAMDIMDIQNARDMIIDTKLAPIESITGFKPRFKKFKYLKDGQNVAVYEVKGDVKVTDNQKSLPGRLGGYTVDNSFISQKQLVMKGYYNNKSKDLMMKPNHSYITEINPKKQIGLGDNTIKWNRALFKATSHYRNNLLVTEGSEVFSKDLAILRDVISMGYSETVTNALSSKVFMGDIFELNKVKEGVDIDNLVKKWESRMSDFGGKDPINLIVRAILKPQLSRSYSIDTEGNYVPHMVTNMHLQKTVLTWALNKGHKDVVSEIMKEVQDFASNKKPPMLDSYERAQSNEYNLNALGTLANPFKTMLKYLGVFYASPEAEILRSKISRNNLGKNKVIEGFDGEGQIIKEINIKKIKPKDLLNKWKEGEC